MIFRGLIWASIAFLIHKTNAIEGGYESFRGDNCFLASVQHRFDEDTDFCHVGHASIISDIWAISAANIFIQDSLIKEVPKHYADRSWDDFIIKYSSNDLYSTNMKICTIIELILHEEFTIKTRQNNIALIKARFYLSVTATPIPLPPLHYNVTVGDLCWCAGWGAVLVYGAYRNNQHQFMLPVASDDICLRRYGFDNYNSYNQFCFGNPKLQAGLCTWDDGAPVMSSDKQFLVGIACRIDNNDCKHHSIVTDVIPYLPWIQETTGIFAETEY